MEATREKELIYFSSIDELIEKGYICVGVLYENRNLLAKPVSNCYTAIRLKIKNTAEIGKVYQTVNDARLWKDNIATTWEGQSYTYSKENGLEYVNVEYPTPTWEMWNGKTSTYPNYIKTAYDENGELVVGTHNGYYSGNSILITGATLTGKIEAIDEGNKEKVNYDLGKNENIVTYSVEPQLDENTNITSQIENVTLKAEVTLPQGLTYIPGSTEYGEPEIINNSTGSSTLVWYIYGVTSGKVIEPIKFNAQINNESENGQQYEVKFVISEVIESDGISKIGNTEITNRTSTETINIINLASHRLYKEVETPIIEKNGQIKYNISYSNNTDETVSGFQLLDILPYNGDSRESNFEGTYTLNNVNVIQTVNGVSQETSNLKLYTTNSDTVRTMTAKDDGIGTDSIWIEKIIGTSLNENVTGFAVKGELAGRSRIDIEITLNTSGNATKNVYVNNAMAQVYKDSEQMQTGTVQAQVVSRKIEGTVWEDSNRNGVIDSSEKYLEGTVVKLLNSTNNAEVTRTTTNAQGEYEFTDLAKGTYKVEVEEYYLWKGVVI